MCPNSEFEEANKIEKEVRSAKLTPHGSMIGFLTT